MEIESLHKYISINKTTPKLIQVLFAGQPCLTVVVTAESTFAWTINPVFAMLRYGANTITDIPYNAVGHPTLEEAIASGLLALEERGAFEKEIDLLHSQHTLHHGHKKRIEDTTGAT